MASFGRLTSQIRSRAQKFSKYIAAARERAGSVIEVGARGADAVISSTSKFLSSFGREQNKLIEASNERLQALDADAQYKMKDRAIAELTARTQSDIKSVVEKYARGRIGIEILRGELESILRTSTLAATVVGTVGIGNLTENVLTASQRQLTAQFERLDGFLNEMSTRELTQKDRARFLMYANSLHSISQTANRQFNLDTYGDPSALEERRVLGSSEHCEDCEALAAEGWVSFGSLPPIGTGTVCRNNCHCTIITRQVTKNNEQSQPVPEAEG